MVHHPLVTGGLLGIAVVLSICCALGVFVMRDAYQRLQFSAPVVSVAITLIVIAIWIEDPAWQSRIKSVLVALILFFTNGILSHATARAFRIRSVGHWPTTEDEHIPVIENHGEAGNIEGGGPA